MKEKKSSLLFVVFIIVQFLFSLEIMTVLNQQNKLVKQMLLSMDLTTLLGKLRGAFLATVIAMICYLILYFFTSVILRSILIENSAQVTNAVFNSLFLSAIITTTITMLVKLTLPTHDLTLVYPAVLFFSFLLIFIGQFKLLRIKFVPVVNVGISALLFCYIIMTRL